jgi:Zn-dependent peptidase ImmA (M78 family)
MPEREVNPYLIKDMEKKLNTSNLYLWIDNEAERIAHLGLSNTNFVNFTPKLMRECKIHDLVPITNRIAGEDAYVIPNGDKYVIYYNENLPEHRLRFAIAHEIGHTYWIKPSSDNLPLSSLQLNKGRDPNIEYLCDRFAASLLLPRKFFLNFLETNYSSNNFKEQLIPSLHLIPLLAKEFHVSEQAVTRRLFFELFPQKIAVICIRNKNSSSSLYLIDSLAQKAKWEVYWCVIPAKLQKQGTIAGFIIPFKTQGRNIPDGMIPNISKSGTYKCDLDSRFWEGIKGQPEKVSKPNLKKWEQRKMRQGYASMCENFLYVALPQ